MKITKKSLAAVVSLVLTGLSCAPPRQKSNTEIEQPLQVQPTQNRFSEYFGAVQWHSPPPEGYDPECPIKSGGFNPYEKFPLSDKLTILPINTPELRNARFTLDDLVEKNKPETSKYVEVYPAMKEWKKNPEFFVLYTAAYDFPCPGCRELEKQGFEEKIKGEINTKFKDKFALIKIQEPERKPRPVIFNYSPGVPTLAICEFKNGSVKPLAEIPQNWSLAVENTKRAMEDALKGEMHGSIILDGDNFRNYEISFSTKTNGKKPFDEHFAFFVGQARFGTEYFSFDAKNSQMIFHGNCENPRVFEYVMQFNNSYSDARKGRDIFSEVERETIKYKNKIAKVNPTFQKVLDWLDEEQGILWNEESSSSRYWERYREFQKRLANITNCCVPNYISEPFKKFIEERIKVFNCQTKEIHVIRELNSQKILELLDSHAQKNNIAIVSHHLPSKEEIYSWREKYNISSEIIDSYINTRRQLQNALDVFQKRGVEYAEPTLPFQPVVELIHSAKNSFVLNAPPEYSDFIEITNEFENEAVSSDGNRPLSDYRSLRALLCLTDFYPRDKYPKNVKLYIPFQETRLGISHHPESTLQGYFEPGMGGIPHGLILLQEEGHELLFPAGSPEPSAKKMREITELDSYMK